MEKTEKENIAFYGWWVVIAGTAVVSVQGVMFYVFGILFPSILNEFGWSRALTSSIQSAQVITNGFFILLLGYLVDRYSPRLLIGVGAVIFCTGMICSSFTHKIWHLYLFFGCIVGVGTSTMYVPPIAVVTRWFEKKRGLALGITLAGMGVGGFLGSPFLNWLIELFGWRIALLILGIVAGSIVFIAAMVLVGHPKEKDLKPYGSEESQTVHINKHSSVGDDKTSIPLLSKNFEWTVWNVLKTRAFLTLYLMNFFAVSTIMGILAHLFIHATENGMPNFTVSWAYSIIGITSLVGKIGMGALSDRIGRKAAFFLSFSVAGTALTLLLHSPNMFTIYIFSVIMGFSYGGWTPLFPATLGDFFGPESMGKIFSILMTNALLGGIFGPVMAGWIFDRMDSYFIAFIIFSGVCYLAAILSLSLKTPKLDPQI